MNSTMVTVFGVRGAAEASEEAGFSRVRYHQASPAEAAAEVTRKVRRLTGLEG